jgi:hypothetical protein
LEVLNTHARKNTKKNRRIPEMKRTPSASFLIDIEE